MSNFIILARSQDLACRSDDVRIQLSRSIEWWRDQWWMQVVFLWSTAGVLVLAAAVTGASYLPPLRGWGEGIPSRVIEGENRSISWSNVLARWDSEYYLKVAADGYSANGDERAFFPLYPALVALVSRTTNLDLFLTGLLISGLSTLAAALGLYLLVSHSNGRALALLSVASMLLFPMGVFWFAFYAESLFLCLSIAAVALMRRGSFVASGIVIALASVARPVGWTLIVPLVYEFIQRKNFSVGNVFRTTLGSAIALLGTIAALAVTTFGQQTNGLSWSTYFQIHEHSWNVYFTLPWISVYDAAMAALFGYNIQPDWFSRVVSIVDLAFALFMIAACVYLAKKIPASLWLWLVVQCVLALSTHEQSGYALYSLPRHVLSAFPLFMFPALLLSGTAKRFQFLGFGIACIVLAMLAAWFGSGRWLS